MVLPGVKFKLKVNRLFSSNDRSGRVARRPLFRDSGEIRLFLAVATTDPHSTLNYQKVFLLTLSPDAERAVGARFQYVIMAKLEDLFY